MIRSERGSWPAPEMILPAERCAWARGEAVHGIVFTPIHGAGVGSPAGDGGAVADFGPNSATFGAAPHESTLRPVVH